MSRVRRAVWLGSRHRRRQRQGSVSRPRLKAPRIVGAVRSPPSRFADYRSRTPGTRRSTSSGLGRDDWDHRVCGAAHRRCAAHARNCNEELAHSGFAERASPGTAVMPRGEIHAASARGKVDSDPSVAVAFPLSADMPRSSARSRGRGRSTCASPSGTSGRGARVAAGPVAACPHQLRSCR